MTRRGLTIRLLIFVPLLAYFGYGAYQKWRNERDEAASYAAAAEAASARDVELKGATRSVVLQDGRSIDIVELTPEQAERLHGIKLPPADDKVVEVVKPEEPAAPVEPAAAN